MVLSQEKCTINVFLSCLEIWVLPPFFMNTALCQIYMVWLLNCDINSETSHVLTLTKIKAVAILRENVVFWKAIFVQNVMEGLCYER